MSVFSNAINKITSTAGRAGKYINTPQARRATRIARGMASQVMGSQRSVDAMMLATVGGVTAGAAFGGEGHRFRGSIKGAAVGLGAGAAGAAAMTPIGQRLLAPAVARGSRALSSLANKVGGGA